MTSSVLTLGLMCVLAGCAGWEPFEPQLPRDIPDGPGLLTGPEGAFVIERPIPTEAGEASGEGSGGGSEKGSEKEGVKRENETGALRPEAGRP